MRESRLAPPLIYQKTLTEESCYSAFFNAIPALVFRTVDFSPAPMPRLSKTTLCQKWRQPPMRPPPQAGSSYLRCRLMILVISNIDTWFLPKTPLSFSSALIMRLLAAS